MSMTNSNSGMNKNLILLKYNYLIVKKKGNNTDDKVGGRMRVELNFYTNDMSVVIVQFFLLLYTWSWYTSHSFPLD